jgi:TPR repeat protein
LQSRRKQAELWGLAFGVAIIIVVAAGAAAILALKLPAISTVAVRDRVSDTKSTTIASAVRNANYREAARGSVQLQWARPPEPKAAIAQTGGVDAPGFAVRKLDPGEIASLRKGGEELFANRDVAAARLKLLRAAEAADARAAFALAKTYDPIALSNLGVNSTFADPAMARTWYEKAREFGSTDAQQRLQRAY